jgi:YjbE family integral membrane protein
MMAEVLTTQFWAGLLAIVWIDIILSGDNAVVIALASRSLPERQQKQAIFWGAGAAVVLRVLLTLVAVQLLQFPYLKLVGGVALLWIAVQLLMPEEGNDDVASSSNLFGAIKTILTADVVMSTDNVIAVAAVAKDSVVLLGLGLLISIPLVISGSTLLLKLMERYPVIITLGAAILGWTAGGMIATDPSVAAWVNNNAAWLHWGLPIAGAVLVVLVGKRIAARSAKGVAAAEIAVAAGTQPSVGGEIMRVLIAVDGSDNSLRAAEYLIKHAPYYKEPLDIHLLNVQQPFPGTIHGVAHEAKRFHEEAGAKALARARKALDAAGLKYVDHISVGDPAEVIAQSAQGNRTDMVVMGHRGAGAVASMVLGSVSTNVLRSVDVPVLLVK